VEEFIPGSSAVHLLYLLFMTAANV